MAESEQKRIRVFAGPNGSGKSTVIDEVSSILIDGYPVDLGIQINADKIAYDLNLSSLSFGDFGLTIDAEVFDKEYIDSGLFDFHAQGHRNPREWYRIDENKVQVIAKEKIEMIAQAVAWIILQSLLRKGVKISFETVFSDNGKIELLKHAKSLGYKVYLYFVSTQNPSINIARVEERVARGGHAVPVPKIIERYKRSLSHLFPALDYVHRAFIIDNTFKNKLVARLFVDGQGKRHWDDIDTKNLPKWFIEYCVQKDPSLQAIITPK